LVSNDIISIVIDRSYYKKYVAVLSVVNLVSDFIKCNHPIENETLFQERG
jgi:hypothetical protein